MPWLPITTPREKRMKNYTDAQSGQVDIDEEEAAENLELPGADLSGEELTVRVVPKQEDEFTCSRCFMVHHATQLAKGSGASAVCVDCA